MSHLNEICDFFKKDKELIISIKNIKYSEKDSYKKQGFKWFKEEKVWWISSKHDNFTKILNELNLEFNYHSTSSSRSIKMKEQFLNYKKNRH